MSDYSGLKCEEILERLDLYMDRELYDAETAAVSAHLAVL